MNTKSLLTKKAILTIAAIASVAIIANLTLLQSTEAVVIDGKKHIYPTAGDIHAITTFKFKDGVEVIDFPVFDMTTSLVANNGPTFSVTGVIGDKPLLNEAIETAWQYRSAAQSYTNIGFQKFDVDVDLTMSDEVVRGFSYKDCNISNASVDTKTGKEDGYLKGTGFTYTDSIDFICAGVVHKNPAYDKLTQSGTVHKFGTIDHGKTPYIMAEDVHAIATFTYGNGVEKIDFPYFKTVSTFLKNTNARPSFEVHGLVGEYPLLYRAVEIDSNRSPNSIGLSRGQETFNVQIDFEQNGKSVRGLNYAECHVESYKVDTSDDSEDSWTSGKTGFAIEDQIVFECLGLKPTNQPFDAMNQIKVNPTTTNSLAYKANQNFFELLPNRSQ